MDDLNVHQLWGLSPFLDLLDCTAAAQEQASCGAAALCNTLSPAETALLQVCPYDCRHTLATLSKAACTAADSCGQQCAKPVEVFVYESEPEGLARHMLLLVVLFDAALTARERAEMFLELHGNVLLRQRTADWLATTSRWLEAAIGGLPCAQSQQPQQHQAQQPNPVQAALDLFDLSLLRYKEQDLLLETFQHYRSKSSFDMAAAWEGRCRKWYADRYDFRQNMVDWDYHMRLSQRGTPFLDPAAGSIIHFYHFRHWRLTGVAYELRGASYTATNTSMLTTAYGRTREYKDRKLQDVGRSVSAYGYWGDILNPPYHAFGTVADDQALFGLVNKQFTHTAMDVAEHNVLSLMKRLSGIAAGAGDAAERQPDNASRDSAGHRANAASGPTNLEGLAASVAQQQETAQDGLPSTTINSSSSSSVCVQAAAVDQKVAAAAAAAAAAAKNASGAAAADGTSDVHADAATAADQSAARLHNMSLQDAQQQHTQQAPLPNSSQVEQQQQLDQEPQAAEADQQTDTEAVRLAAAVKHLQQHVKIRLLTGDLKRSLTGKDCYKQRFDAATVGHRHVHMLAHEMGIAGVLQAGAPVFVETAANMVQLNGEQVAAFDKRLLEVAASAGFEAHPAFSTQQPGPEGQQQQQQQQQKGLSGPPTASGAALSAHEAACAISKSRKLPAGHLALRVSL